MKKHLFAGLTTIFLVLNLVAQDTVSVMPKGFRPDWILLRMLQGGQAYYLQSADNVPLDKPVHFIFQNRPAGEYAIQYSVNDPRGFRFIYNKETMLLVFDKNGKPVSVKGSKENQIYFEFLRQYDSIKSRLKKQQRQYALYPRNEIVKSYQNTRKSYYNLFDKYSKEAKGLFADHLIAVYKDVFPERPFTSLDEQLQYDEAHYFDYTPMNDSLLYHSNVLTDRIMRYIFRMPVKSYGKERTATYIKRLKNIFDRLIYLPMRAEMLRGFLAVFSTQDRDVTSYLLTLYNKLPAGWRDERFTANLTKSGIPVKGDRFDVEKLHKVGKFHLPAHKKYYLFVFYSSDCPHCQRALPWIYRRINNKDIAVLAIGLETDKSHWERFTAPLNKWQHIAAYDNQYNQLVKDYHIEYTPTWFLTDDKFRILEIVSGENEIKDVLRYFQLIPEEIKTVSPSGENMQ